MKNRLFSLLKREHFNNKTVQIQQLGIFLTTECYV